MDLLSLNIHDFDVILDMDLLSGYHATMDCFRKEVTFRILGESEFVFFLGDIIITPISLILVLEARKLLKK